MKVAIIGSRSYHCLDQVLEFVNKLKEGTVVVSGGANGVDKVAEAAAKARGLKTLIFLPDWDKYGNRAGLERNKLIIDAADGVIAFWDEVSRGTVHSMSLARLAKKPLIVYGKDGKEIRWGTE